MNRFILFSLTLVAWVSIPLIVFAENNILFVGNSFTYSRTVTHYNSVNVHDENGTGQGGVPGIFQKMASSLSYESNISIEALGAQTLAFHYAHKGAIIGQAKWNWVILQGYSTEPTLATAGGISGFYKAVDDLKKLILKANPDAKILLYETWARPDLCVLPGGSGHTFPSLDAMLAQLRTNYAKANATYGLQGVAPVGDAFAWAIADKYAESSPFVPDNTKFDLWANDNYHASNYGSYLAAAVLTAKITGLDPRTIPTGAGSSAADLGISSTDADHLNLIAYQVTSTATEITSETK